MDPLYVGDTVYFGCGHGTLRPRKPIETGRLMFWDTSIVGTPDQWILTDPTGTYKTGEMLPIGAVILLRQGGLSPSADPAFPDLRMSVNTASWEWWIVTE